MTGPSPMIFSIVPALVGVIFVVVIVMFIVYAVKGLSEWSSNNQQPVHAEPVIVRGKRTHIWGGGHHHGHGHVHSGSRTSYYVTFEYEDGERREFMVSGRVYGQMAEGDTGTLTYQGTRYHNFERVSL